MPNDSAALGRFVTRTTPVPTLPSPPPKKSLNVLGPMGVAEQRKMTFLLSDRTFHFCMRK